MIWLEMKNKRFFFSHNHFHISGNSLTQSYLLQEDNNNILDNLFNSCDNTPGLLFNQIRDDAIKTESDQQDKHSL